MSTAHSSGAAVVAGAAVVVGSGPGGVGGSRGGSGGGAAGGGGLGVVPAAGDRHQGRTTARAIISRGASVSSSGCGQRRRPGPAAMQPPGSPTGDEGELPALRHQSPGPSQISASSSRKPSLTKRVVTWPASQPPAGRARTCTVSSSVGVHPIGEVAVEDGGREGCRRRGQARTDRPAPVGQPEPAADPHPARRALRRSGTSSGWTLSSTLPVKGGGKVSVGSSRYAAVGRREVRWSGDVMGHGVVFESGVEIGEGPQHGEQAAVIEVAMVAATVAEAPPRADELGGDDDRARFAGGEEVPGDRDRVRVCRR